MSLCSSAVAACSPGTIQRLSLSFSWTAMYLQMERGYEYVQGDYRHICMSVLATCNVFEGFHMLTHMIQLHNHLVLLPEKPRDWGTAVSLTCTDSLLGMWCLPRWEAGACSSIPLCCKLLSQLICRYITFSSAFTRAGKLWCTCQKFQETIWLWTLFNLKVHTLDVIMHHSQRINYNIHLWPGDACSIEGTFSPLISPVLVYASV